MSFPPSEVVKFQARRRRRRRVSFFRCDPRVGCVAAARRLARCRSPTSDGGMEASTTVSVLRRTAVEYVFPLSHHLKLAKFQAPRRRRRRVDVGSADPSLISGGHVTRTFLSSILNSAYSPPTSHSARGRGISRRHGSHEPAEGSAGRGAIQAPAGARDPPAADVTTPTNLTTRASRKPPTGKPTTQHLRTPFPQRSPSAWSISGARRRWTRTTTSR